MALDSAAFDCGKTLQAVTVKFGDQIVQLTSAAGRHNDQIVQLASVVGRHDDQIVQLTSIVGRHDKQMGQLTSGVAVVTGLVKQYDRKLDELHADSARKHLQMDARMNSIEERLGLKPKTLEPFYFDAVPEMVDEEAAPAKKRRLSWSETRWRLTCTLAARMERLWR